jgi:hypothetical protein
MANDLGMFHAQSKSALHHSYVVLDNSASPHLLPDESDINAMALLPIGLHGCETYIEPH